MTQKIKDGDQIMMQSYLAGSGSLVTMTSGSKTSSKNQVKKTVATLKTDEDGDSYQRWGEDNDWPTKIREKVEKSTTAYPLIFKMASLIYGTGISYYEVDYIENKETLVFNKYKEIDDFFDKSNISRFLLEQLMDYKFYGNCFSELIFNLAGDKVYDINHLEAEFSRLGIQKNKEIKKLYYLGNWEDYNIDYAAKIDFLENKKLTRDEILAKVQTSKKIALHTFFPSPGRKYYAAPPHAAIYRENGWLDFANSVPEIMNALVKNQMTIKYHIQIPYEYWPSMYKDWNTFKDPKKKQLIDEKLKEMDNWLAGKENAGKAFISHFATDPITRKKISGWEITPIQDTLKKDDWIPGTQEADTQIARALGVDLSMSGVQSNGGKLGAGSGSDKRVGFQNTVSLSYAEQQVLLEPLYLIKKINKWPDGIKFSFSHLMPTTLDKNPTGAQKQL